MRLAKALYYPFFDHDKVLTIGNIMFEMDGILMNVEDIPDSYLVDHYGFTKEELYEMIANELEMEFYNEFK